MVVVDPDDYSVAARKVAARIEEWQLAAARIAPHVLEAQRKAAERIAASNAQAHAAMVGDWIEAHRETLIEPLLRATQRWRESWEEAIPPNLRELHGEELFRALEITAGEGPCVVWTPRAEIVEELVTGKTFADRCVVLVKRREELLSDMAVALSESTVEVLSEQAGARDLAGKAVDAARDKHDAPAQALAAAALACVLQDVLHYAHLGTAYKDMKDRDIEETEFGVMRLVAIESATSRALVDTKDHVAGFNRHGTLHGRPAFYGEGEMLASLLLLVAWVRELSWLAEHEPSFLVDAT